MAIKVLVFESDPAFAETLRQGLLRYGCEVSVVDDANTGLQAAAREKPDLILLAIELPRMNGFSVCNKLKRDPALKDVPLIIMSSESTEETFEQHRRLRTRAEDYVHKPISFDDLMGRAQSYVALAERSDHGPSPSQAPLESDAAIEIDEDIEIEDAEVVDNGEEAAPTPSSTRGVDADVDDFAEQAFGAMMDGPDVAATAGSIAPSSAPFSSTESESARPGAHQLELDDTSEDIVMDDAEIALSEPPPDFARPDPLAPISMDDDPMDAMEIESTEEVEVAEAEASPSFAPAASLVPAPAASAPYTPASARPPAAPLLSTPPSAPPATASGPARFSSMRPSSLPPRAAELGDVGKYREELDKSRSRAKEFEDELRRTKDRVDELEDASKRGSAKDLEVQRMQRELDEAKAKLASSGKSAGTAREFLDLREQLNKKDKEILDFRDQLSHKEKQLLGLRDGAIALEREKADLSDGIAELEKQIFDLGRTSEALKSDREQAVKRADDFKRKAEKTKLDLDARIIELTDLALAHQGQLAERDEREAGLVADHQQVLQEEARAMEQALAAAEAAGQTRADAARQEARAVALAEQERTLAALDRETELRIRDAVAARDAELRKELESKLAGLHRANDDAMGKLRAEHQQSLIDAAAESADRLSAREAEMIAEQEREQAKEAADHSAALMALVDQKQASETLRDARIAAVESELQSCIAERDSALALVQALNGQVAQLEADLSQRTNERDSNALTLQQRDTRIAQLEADLSERTTQRELQKQNLEARDTRIAALEAALASVNQEAADATRELQTATRRLSHASSKWGDDRVSLERAKDALAAALAQIEEAEARSFE